MNINFETDVDGFLSQECPSCHGRFKALFEDESDAALSFCPYCRHTGEDHWFTPEQLDYVRSVATEAVVRPQLEQWKRQIGGSGSGMFDIKVTDDIPDVVSPPLETIDDYGTVYFRCCTETIKAEQRSRHYCVICGKEQEANMEGKRIFLSHKGSDKKMVLEYKGILEELGYSPWLDDEAMPAGTAIERGLIKGMEESCAVVFFVTANFEDAGFLETEINYALAEKRKKGSAFSIITLVFDEPDGESDIDLVVPTLLRQYVWKQPRGQLHGLREILRALPERARAYSTSSTGGSLASREVELELSEDGKTILMTAAEGDGEVACVRVIGGSRIYAGSKYIMNSNDPREIARWEAAVEELRRFRYIKDVGHKGEVFQLTKAGWDLADSLKGD